MRGYQKKVIFLKNAGSDIFDEAYFVLKTDEKTRIFSHATMVSEAKRIIEENFGAKRRRLRILNLPVLFAFIIGSLASFIIALIFL